MHLHNPLGTLLTLPLALISISSLSGLSPLRARQSHTPKGRGVIHVHGIWEQHPSGCLDTSGSFVYNDCAVFGARRLPGSAGVNFVSKNGVCEFTPDIFRCGEGGSGLEGAAFMVSSFFTLSYIWACFFPSCLFDGDAMLHAKRGRVEPCAELCVELRRARITLWYSLLTAPLLG